MLALTGVRKRYGRGPWVLDGIDLALPPGTLGMVLGGNGSGKSTLLRIAAGASRASAGTVSRPAVTGYAPDRLPGSVRMTARAYLGHMARLRRAPAHRAGALLDQLAVSGPDLPIGSLSKGNRQKVALAQAFLAPAGLLVLDEPGSGLDPAARVELDALLAGARAAGAAVLVAAHTPSGPADRTWSLTGARLTERTPAERAPSRGVPASAMRLVFEAAGPGRVVDLPGTTGVAYDEARRELRVSTTDTDAVLRLGLDAGWSLRRAEPE